MVGPVCESCQEKECYRNELSFTHIFMCVYTSRWLQLKHVSCTDPSVPVVASTKWQAIVLLSQKWTQGAVLSHCKSSYDCCDLMEAQSNSEFPTCGRLENIQDTSRLTRASSALWVASLSSRNPRNSRLHYLLTCVTLQDHTESVESTGHSDSPAGMVITSQPGWLRALEWTSAQ